MRSMLATFLCLSLKTLQTRNSQSLTSLLVALLLSTAFPFPGKSRDLPFDPSLIRLIPAFGRHFYIHEAVFFSLAESGSDAAEESQTLVRIQRILSVERYPSSVVRNVREFRNQRQRWPLCVVLFLRAEASLAFVKEVFGSSAVFTCTWLLLDPPAMSEVRLPIDSEIFVARLTGDGSRTVVVTDVYRAVHNEDYEETDIVVWRPDTGISRATRQSLPLRRSDLTGVVVKFLLVLEEPWVLAVDDDDVTTFHGYVPDVADVLVACTNISFRNEIQRDHQYGLSLSPGNWTGMIGEILTSPDLIVGGPLSITQERFGIIHFSKTLYNDRDIMVIRRPTNEHDADSWQRLMSPFRLPVWIAVLSCFLASGTFLYILAGGRRISDGLLKAAGVICGQAVPSCEGPPRPGARAASSRVLVLSLHFTAICLVASYTGQLTAYLGIRHVDAPFFGLEGLLRSGTRVLGLQEGSSSHDYFDKSGDLLSVEIYNKMVVGQQLPASDEEGLNRVCQDKSYALVIDEQSFKSIVKHFQCQFLEIPDAFLVNKLSLATSRNFQYKGIFDYWLMRLKKHGILSRLESKNWPSMEEIVSEELISVNIEVVAPLLAGLGTGMLASLLVFTLELQYHRIRRA